MYMQVTSDTIRWNKVHGNTEFSDLGVPVGHFPTMLDVRSHKTGVTVTFYIHTMHRDADNDVAWVDYRAWNRDRPLFLRVFND
jgi:hypothetical protein